MTGELHCHMPSHKGAQSRTNRPSPTAAWTRGGVREMLMLAKVANFSSYVRFQWMPFISPAFILLKWARFLGLRKCRIVFVLFAYLGCPHWAFALTGKITIQLNPKKPITQNSVVHLEWCKTYFSVPTPPQSTDQTLLWQTLADIKWQPTWLKCALGNSG